MSDYLKPSRIGNRRYQLDPLTGMGAEPLSRPRLILALALAAIWGVLTCWKH